MSAGIGSVEDTDVRRLSRRERWFAPLGGLALSVAMTFPLVLVLGSELSEVRLLDSLLEVWLLAWGGHALVDSPGSFFDSNRLWPMRDSLAVTESFAGYAPFSVFGSGFEAGILRYNLITLFALALSFVGAYLLARELRLSPAGAGVAAAVYAFAPYRMASLVHLHVISSGPIPLTLFLLLRGYRTRTPWMIVTGFLMAAWQVSVSMTLGLFLLTGLGAAGLVAVVWLVVRRPRVTRPIVLATVGGVAVMLAISGVIAAPYQRVARAESTFERSVDDVRFFSPPPGGLLASSERNRAWGDLTSGPRERLDWPSEQALFPGVAVAGLFAAGLGSAAFSRRRRTAIAAGVAGVTVLALGFNGPFGGAAYRALFEWAPGWGNVRTPGRLWIVALLGIGLLAGGAAQRAVERCRQSLPAVAPLLASVLLGLVLLDGATEVPLHRPDPVPASWTVTPEPQLHLPMDAGADVRYMAWSVEGFPSLVNGYSAFTPRHQQELLDVIDSFPDERSVQALRRLGVRLVVVHRDLVTGTRWEGAADASADGLGLRREERGRDVLFHVPLP